MLSAVSALVAALVASARAAAAFGWGCSFSNSGAVWSVYSDGTVVRGAGAQRTQAETVQAPWNVGAVTAGCTGTSAVFGRQTAASDGTCLQQLERFRSLEERLRRVGTFHGSGAVRTEERVQRLQRLQRFERVVGAHCSGWNQWNGGTSSESRPAGQGASPPIKR